MSDLIQLALTDPDDPDTEALLTGASPDGTEIATAILSRCKAVISKHPNTVKDRIIAIAKEQGHSISRGDISNVKVEKIKGGYSDWGTKLLSIKAIDDDPIVDKTIVFDDGYDNHGPQVVTRKFGYAKDIERQTSWTFKLGVKIKGGTAAFSGYEIDFGVEHQILHSETDHVTWSNDIPVSPHSAMKAYAILEIGHATSTVTGIFEITKGKANISCDISKWGTHHKKQDIDLTEILYKPDLRRFTSQGIYKSDISLKSHTSSHEEPLA